MRPVFVDESPVGAKCDCENLVCEVNSVHVAGSCRAVPDGKYDCDGFKQNLCEYCRHVAEIEA